MIWSNRYVGIPYAEFGRDRAGCDCYGLACIVYREEMRIGLPDYHGTYSSADEHEEIAALIAGEAASPLWTPVAGEAQPFDIAVFRRGRLDSHVGIVIRPGLMVHMQDEDCAKVVGFEHGPWAHRLKGHWRHRSSRHARPGNAGARSTS